jgi:hypothetical protein
LDIVNFGYNEYKFLVTNEKLRYVADVLESLHGGSDPFPSGVVDSVYYDTLDRRFYGQSLNGEARKRKFRIRGYGDGQFHQIHLKDKDLTIIRKLKDKIQPVHLDGHNAPFFHELYPKDPSSQHFHAIMAMAQQYGVMIPVVRVRYQRRRFRINDYRLTLDTQVEVMGFSNGIDLKHHYAVLPHHVLEIKTVDRRPYLPLLGLSSLPQVSYSKFFMGLNVLATGEISVS